MSAGRIRKPIAALAIVGVFAMSVPVAQAAPPDAVERAVRNHQVEHSFVGSPDAIDRALAVREAERIAAIDARERGLTERPGRSMPYAPDALERAVITHADAINAQTVSMLDSREQALSERPAVSSSISVTGSEPFAWSEFGMGAGAAIGLVLVAGLGALALRRGQRVTTA
jgi:hypothetical protein